MRPHTAILFVGCIFFKFIENNNQTNLKGVGKLVSAIKKAGAEFIDSFMQLVWERSTKED